MGRQAPLRTDFQTIAPRARCRLWNWYLEHRVWYLLNPHSESEDDMLNAAPADEHPDSHVRRTTYVPGLGTH